MLVEVEVRNQIAVVFYLRDYRPQWTPFFYPVSCGGIISTQYGGCDYNQVTTQKA